LVGAIANAMNSCYFLISFRRTVDF